jgi:hypothetical protein
MEWNFDYVKLREVLIGARGVIRATRPLLPPGVALIDGQVPGQEDADRIIEALTEQIKIVAAEIMPRGEPGA